jgi:hypothetical protein
MFKKYYLTEIVFGLNIRAKVKVNEFDCNEVLYDLKAIQTLK